MATNFVQPGDTITIPAPAETIAGAVVITGSIIGVAAGDAASGASLDVETRGVWDLPKVGTDVVTVGAPIYWDADVDLATVTATDNTKIGVAVAAAGNGAASVRVRLSGF